MENEPITIFARIADPAGVAALLREMDPKVRIIGGDDEWEQAEITFGRLRGKRRLILRHNPEYYAEPNWSAQMNGMRGYFSRFPDSERKPHVLLLTSTLRFALSAELEPAIDPEGDPRLDVLFAVTDLIDGVLFTPSALRDSQGRILFSAHGAEDEDPEAEFPRVLAEVDVTEATEGGDGNEEQQLDPPDATRVARRALALAAVTARAILEQDTDNEAAPSTAADLLAWLTDLRIADELEAEELAVLECPVGELEQGPQIGATWRLEGLGVLAWALGKYEIPAHDELVSLDALWESVGLLNRDVSSRILARPALRSHDEIAELANRLFAVHWRLRNFHIDPSPMDFADFAATCWFGPLDIAGLPLIDGDLALQGERIDRASEDVFSSALSEIGRAHV